MKFNHLILCCPLSSCLQSFPASGSFPRCQLFTSGGQSIGVSASTSVLPINTQDSSPLGWNGWISLQYKTEKAMALHSSTLAWKIPWMEEPRRLQSMGVAEGRTPLRDFTFTFHFHALEKEMATHSSVLAWRIPGTGELGGLPSMGWHRVGHY